MPGRTLSGAEGYRYAFQGQEIELARFADTSKTIKSERQTDKEAFQLRLWDSRIGRWLTTDPKGAGYSPYWGMNNNPISLIDPDGGKTDDWYEKLDADGNGTGVYDWFDGSFDIEGYEHIGFEFVETIFDIEGNKTQIKYDGATKSSYIYNGEAGKFDLLRNYDNTSIVKDFLMDKVNSSIAVGDQTFGAFVGSFQGVGIAMI